MEPSPFTSCPKSRLPRSLQADARILIAEARTTMPAAVVKDFPLNFAVFIKSETSASSTPTPVSPFTSPFHSSVARSVQTDARILMEAAKRTICVAPFIEEPPLMLSSFTAPTIAAIKAVTPATPFASCPPSKSPIFFRADARIRIDVDMASITVELFTAPLTSPLILVKTDMDAINSAKRTVIAPSDADNFSLSIREIATIDAARIAIALAIFSKVPAFNCV